MSEKSAEDIVYCDVHAWTQYDEHHIIPQSRGGRNSYLSLWQKLLQGPRKLFKLPPPKGKKNNVNRKTCIWCHHRSHDLTANKTPDEIIDHFVGRLWDGQIRWVFIYLVKHLLERSCEIACLSRLKKKQDATVSQQLQTTRLRRSLEEEILIRKIVYDIGLETLKGDLRIRRRIHELDLKFGDLCRVDDATRELIGSARMNGGKTRKELLEEIIGDQELGPTESIRSVIWRKHPN